MQTPTNKEEESEAGQDQQGKGQSHPPLSPWCALKPTMWRQGKQLGWQGTSRTSLEPSGLSQHHIKDVWRNTPAFLALGEVDRKIQSSRSSLIIYSSSSDQPRLHETLSKRIKGHYTKDNIGKYLIISGKAITLEWAQWTTPAICPSLKVIN